MHLMEMNSNEKEEKKKKEKNLHEIEMQWNVTQWCLFFNIFLLAVHTLLLKRKKINRYDIIICTFQPIYSITDIEHFLLINTASNVCVCVCVCVWILEMWLRNHLKIDGVSDLYSVIWNVVIFIIPVHRALYFTDFGCF